MKNILIVSDIRTRKIIESIEFERNFNTYEDEYTTIKKRLKD
jgi:hypothetical protein